MMSIPKLSEVSVQKMLLMEKTMPFCVKDHMLTGCIVIVPV